MNSIIYYKQTRNNVILSKLIRWMTLIVPILVVILIFGCTQQGSSGKPLKIAINAGPEGDAIKQLVANGYPKGKIEIIELPYQSLREQLITVLKEKQSSFDIVMVDDPWFPQLAPNLRELRGVPQSLISDIVPACLKLGLDPYPNGKLRALPSLETPKSCFTAGTFLSD